MSTMRFVGSSPLKAQLFTFTYPHATGAGEPNVGDVVYIDNTGKAAKSDANGKQNIIGVVVAKSGGFVTVCMHGIVEVVADAAVNVGARLMSSANGRVRPVPAAGGTYSPADVENAKAVLGVALTSAASAGDKVIMALSVV